jgi:multidrug efflux pump subunit AcrB
MNVARFAIRNARAIVLGVVLLTGAGVYSMSTLPSNIYPEVEFPRIVMVAKAGDLAPRMMQLAVTRPLEEAARTVLGVRRVRSRTIRGATELSIIFNPDADMPYSLQLMQAKADEVKSELPANTQLAVERMTPSLFPSSSSTSRGISPPPTSATSPPSSCGRSSPACPASPTSRSWRATSAKCRSSSTPRS